MFQDEVIEEPLQESAVFEEVIERLELLMLMGAELPVSSIHRQIASAIDIIVHIDRLPTGKRVVSQVSEVTGVHPHTTDVMITVIGPVGSEINRVVPPNSAANRPTITAPYSPACGPSPEATPKVSANGNETTAVVTPPARSTVQCFSESRLIINPNSFPRVFVVISTSDPV